MKTKLEMAHDYAMQHLKNSDGKITMHSLCLFAWQYADAMQVEVDKRNKAEADKRENKETCDKSLNIDSKGLNVEEWQPDWSQAPEWANWWVIGSLTKQGIWSEAKPNSVRINGADYWEVTSPIGDEHLSVAPSFNYQGDWRDSLRKRPE